MLVKSEALVLRKTPYAENSAVVKVLTASHGILSFMVSGMTGKRNKAAHLQPGNWLEIVYYFQANKNLNRIKEMQLIQGFPLPSEEPYRIQLRLFFLELLQKSLPEEQEDPSLFVFARDRFARLENANQPITWLTHSFILGLLNELGHAPDFSLASDKGLDLETGTAPSSYTKPHFLITPAELDICKKLLLEVPAEGNHTFRRELAEKLLHYLHAQVFPEKEIRSFEVLKSLMD
jgi:DNA repair protein RecO (recombination protein O)